MEDLLNNVDEVLSGNTGSKGGTVLMQSFDTGTAITEPVPDIKEVFSKFMVVPDYHVILPDGILIKLSTSTGEPFYLLDREKVAAPVVCSMTKIFAAPYDPDTACEDECEGLPAVHPVDTCQLRELLNTTIKNSDFLGLVLVSNVSIQLYYRLETGEYVNKIYRVAKDAEGNIETRDTPNPVTCDYPVPYLTVDYGSFSTSPTTCKILSDLKALNSSLIDNLCKQQYLTLHSGEVLPDNLEQTLGRFMYRHSHQCKALLEKQCAEECNSFVRKQRKREIDNLTRLMLREVDLIGQIQALVKELCHNQKLVEGDQPEYVSDEEADDQLAPPSP